MVTATRKKPGLTKKHTPRRKALRSPKKKPTVEKPTKAAGQGDYATNQKVLVPDADERIPELDEACQRFLSEQDKRTAAKQAADEQRQAIGELLKQHDLNLYKMNGKKFYIDPGTPQVKVVKLNQKG